MKKILTLLVVLSMGFVFSNCGTTTQGPACQYAPGVFSSELPTLAICDDYTNMTLTTTELGWAQDTCASGNGQWSSSEGCFTGDPHVCTELTPVYMSFFPYGVGTMDRYYNDANFFNGIVSYTAANIGCSLAGGTWR